ncbi:MAG: hypothetical protein SXG53_02425 [Pseudomonadota bacterium]|nr:hypothetical protein [Pseudomonadota bacterium]
MKVDICCRRRNATKFLSVQAGTDPSKLKLPASFDPDLKQLARFKTGLDINPGDPTIGLNPAEVIAQITRNGYAVHSAPILAKEKI